MGIYNDINLFDMHMTHKFVSLGSGGELNVDGYRVYFDVPVFRDLLTK